MKNNKIRKLLFLLGFCFVQVVNAEEGDRGITAINKCGHRFRLGVVATDSDKNDICRFPMATGYVPSGGSKKVLTSSVCHKYSVWIGYTFGTTGVCTKLKGTETIQFEPGSVILNQRYCNKCTVLSEGNG